MKWWLVACALWCGACVNDDVAPNHADQSVGDLDDAHDLRAADLLGADLDFVVPPDLIIPDLAPLTGVTQPNFSLADTGLEGGAVTSVAVTSTQVYAMTQYRVFVSSDDALTWTPASILLNAGASFVAVTAAFGTSAKNVAYVSTSDNQLWKTSDAGATFSVVSLSFGPTSLDSIFASKDGTSLYVIQYITGTPTVFLFDGSTWHTLTGFPSTPTAFGESDDKVAQLISNGADGIAKLTQPTAGTYTWTKIASVSGSFIHITGDATTEHIATNSFTTGLGYYNGTTWATVFPSTAGMFMQDVALSGTTFVGFDRQAVRRWVTTGNVTWTSTSLPGTYIFHGIIPTAGRIYVGANAGMLYSADTGASFHSRHNGLRAATVNQLAGKPGDASTVFAGTTAGLFKSSDRGKTWTMNTQLPEMTAVYAIAIASSAPSTMYVAAGHGIFRSTDSGGTFAQVAGLADLGDVTALAVSATDATRLLACANDTLKLSVNSGATFTAPTGVASCTDDGIVFDPNNGMHAFINDGGQVWESTNGGSSFAVNSAAQLPTNGPYVIRMFPGSTILYLRGTTQVRTWDGATLASLTLPSGIHLSSLAVDPMNAKIVYLATTTGLLESTDGGKSFSDASAGLPSLRQIDEVLVHPADRTLRLAAPTASGVYQSEGAPAL